MTIEEKLQELILERYNSIREFSAVIDMPHTTIHSLFKRGIGKSSVITVTKICKALNISVDALADGEIKPAKKTYQPKRLNDWIEVDEIIDETKEILESRGFITIDGKPIGVNQLEAIFDAMDVGVELAKRKNN